MDERIFAQEGYRCRLEWGKRGLRDAARRNDILVIVDVLSFSSAAVTAINNGGSIRPCPSQADADTLVRIFGGIAAVKRSEVPEKGRYSLSPLTYLDMPLGTTVILPSPNGAACCQSAALYKVPHVLVGALLNAQAVGDTVNHLLDFTDLAVTVLACGERWWTEHPDGDLRFALEDYLGAGAILSTLTHNLSPEARVCAEAFRVIANDIQATLWECGSGRELREKGYGQDVEHASQWNVYTEIPYLSPGGFLHPIQPENLAYADPVE